MVKRASRNRTLRLSTQEKKRYRSRLLRPMSSITSERLKNRTICGDLFEVIKYFPSHSVDLLFVDPPYNLDKNFGAESFQKVSDSDYAIWVESWLKEFVRVLKKDASIYLCSDWRSSAAVQWAAEKYFKLRTRITWEREKGRGARRNWKNNSEDILFCTVSDHYKFNADAVKMKRKVRAPYRTMDGKPKDWVSNSEGNFRLTHPSNLWTDLTVPFWSMSENTDHPTQKPEKLLAKIILASSEPGDLVLDPFLGSGTTSVVAKKLGRNFVGIEKDETYCCLAEKRLDRAEEDLSIQGYNDGVFWERNTLAEQARAIGKVGSA